MKLMVHNSNIEFLTFGKYYYVTSGSLDYSVDFEVTGTWWVKVLCDDGVTRSIHQSHFITIEEWRDKQLNRLEI
jgi:hypothetical protein